MNRAVVACDEPLEAPRKRLARGIRHAGGAHLLVSGSKPGMHGGGCYGAPGPRNHEARNGSRIRHPLRVVASLTRWPSATRRSTATGVEPLFARPKRCAAS